MIRGVGGGLRGSLFWVVVFCFWSGSCGGLFVLVLLSFLGRLGWVFRYGGDFLYSCRMAKLLVLIVPRLWRFFVFRWVVFPGRFGFRFLDDSKDGFPITV